jgi:3',5'-cyclic AMP phosphodiesterase CpdA
LDRLPYTILHISDLHRSPTHPIGNDELLSSLVSDFERAATEDPTFGPPDAIVVSGDLVQGVPLGDC